MSGKLAQAGRLEVSLTVVGSYELDRDSVELDDSDGCKRATHVVSTLSAGAFELSSGGESEAAAGVGVGGAGVRAEKQSRREVLNRAGDESACEGARSGDAAPPPGCGALLRVVLRPARRPKPAAATVEPAPVVGEAPKEPKAPKEPTDGGAPTTEPVAAREPAVEPATPERSTPPLADETRARPAEPSRPGSLAGLVLAVALAGCDGRAGYVAEPAARLEAARAACEPELDPRRFVEQAVTGGCRIEPGAAARASDRITVAEVAGRTGSTFVVRLDDASDDSIRAEEHRIELERGAGGWRIVWAGHRWACWPGRGHEGFGTAPCS